MAVFGEAEIKVKMNLDDFIRDLREMAEVHRGIAKAMQSAADDMEKRRQEDK